MKSIHILFCFHSTHNSDLAKILCETMNLTLFDFPLELRKQIKDNTKLSREIKEHLDRGELVGTQILQRFFKLKLLKLADGDILLT